MQVSLRAKPLTLRSAVKQYTLDQDKVVGPSTTVINAAERIGELDDLAAAQLDDCGSVVDGAFSYVMRTDLLSTTGKGLTALQAQASAVMEFVERYSWLHFDYAGYPGYRVASHRELAADGVPTVSLDYFTRNFVDVENRRELEQEIAGIPMKWIAATAWPDETPFLYPINWHNYLFSSNGLAAGNTLEEAIVQAACELLERETVYRLYVEGEVGYEIDPNGLEHPLLAAAVAGARDAGIELLIREISSVFGVPAFVVQGTRASDAGKLTHQGVGQGCHLDPTKALIRAMAEYFEGFASVRALQDRGGLNWHAVRKVFPKLHHGFHALYNPENLVRCRGRKRLEEVPDRSNPDLLEEIRTLAGVFAAQGWPMTVVDKTRPALGIPTVRVFVPEARSCLNTDFLGSPAATISAVYHEAGNRDAGRRWSQAMLRTHPSFEIARANSLATELLSKMISQAEDGPLAANDFQHNMLVLGRTKKNGARILETIAEHKHVIGPMIDYLDPPEIVLPPED
jgi:ribosomal protein S12 methylthiotransferase accessory factor